MSVYALTFAASVAIKEKVVPFRDRWSLKPLSLLDLSLHDRLIWEEETAAAVKLVGAAGTGVGLGVTAIRVVALAVFEKAELPPAL